MSCTFLRLEHKQFLMQHYLPLLPFIPVSVSPHTHSSAGKATRSKGKIQCPFYQCPTLLHCVKRSRILDSVLPSYVRKDYVSIVWDTIRYLPVIQNIGVTTANESTTLVYVPPGNNRPTLPPQNNQTLWQSSHSSNMETPLSHNSREVTPLGCNITLLPYQLNLNLMTQAHFQ